MYIWIVVRYNVEIVSKDYNCLCDYNFRIWKAEGGGLEKEIDI